MENWQKFEQLSTQYLNQEFQNHGVTFINSGQRDSNSPDILVIDSSTQQTITCIECKYSPSQSGQFAVLETGNSLALSPRNKNFNSFSKQIISEYLKHQNTQLISKSLLYGWIKEHYRKKNVSYFITSNELNSYYAFVELQDFDKYFDVNVTVRRKRSGTRNITTNSFPTVMRSLEIHLNSINVVQRTFKKLNNGWGVIVDRELNKSEQYYKLFYLSREKDMDGIVYRVKRRSKTNNLNFIFEVNYIGQKSNINKFSFKASLENKGFN